MANVDFINLAKFTATAGTTANFVVSTPVTGYQTPLTAGASNFNYRYRAESADLTQWEIGTGAYTSSNTTLTRVPSANSAGGSSAINFTFPPQVGLILSADDIQATGQILGTASSDSAIAGNVAEYIESIVTLGSAVTMTTATTATVTSIALTAGDWDVWGTGWFSGGAATTVNNTFVSISTASGSLNLNVGFCTQDYRAGQTTFANTNINYNINPVRKSLGSSESAFLTVQATFGSSNMIAYGMLRARRAR